MPDHDFKDGGWKNKYIVFKRCPDCGGEGWGTHCACRSVGECMHSEKPCPTCKGTGFLPADPIAVYFVLRLDEDPHARTAAAAYANSIQRENVRFAMDIRKKLAETHKQEFEA